MTPPHALMPSGPPSGLRQRLLIALAVAVCVCAVGLVALLVGEGGTIAPGGAAPTVTTTASPDATGMPTALPAPPPAATPALPPSVTAVPAPPSATPAPPGIPSPTALPLDTPTLTPAATALPLDTPTLLPTATTLAPPPEPSATAVAAPPSTTPAEPPLAPVDVYIGKLTPAQQIGELLMIPVYADAYSPEYDVYLQQDQIANAIMFTDLNGGPLKPPTLAGFRMLTQAVIAHARNPLIIATDEEGGVVDRLAPYYGPSPSAAALGATGDPQQAYQQGQLDAGRLRGIGINVDFAPDVDVDQGGAIGPGRMFAGTAGQVTQFAGAFLDGLQQHGVLGTLKHWPGLGAAATNPDQVLPTIGKTQAQLNATDFAPFRTLLARHPGLIMVTHVMEPAYDPQYPASLSPILVDGVLRGQLGYQGVVVSDAMAAGAIGGYMRSRGYGDPVQAVGEASVLAILAGEDMIECPNDPAQIAGTVRAVTRAVQSGRITPARLRLSLERIIALKVRLGLVTLPP